eukprot:14558216-Heterocapsa_arctica.AAC.1
MGHGYVYAGVTLVKGAMADKAIVRDVIFWLTELELLGHLRLRSDCRGARKRRRRPAVYRRGEIIE